MNFICGSVVSNGGAKPPVFVAGASMPAVYTTTAADEKSIFAISLKETLDGLPNRIQLQDIKFKVSVLTNPMQIKIYKNATITAPTWLSVGAMSGTSYATTISSCSGGRLVDSFSILCDTGGGAAADGFVQNADSLTGFSLSRSAFNDGSDNLCVTAKRLTASNGTVILDAKWEEIR
jgi:hypothetical protein